MNQQEKVKKVMNETEWYNRHEPCTLYHVAQTILLEVINES